METKNIKEKVNVKALAENFNQNSTEAQVYPCNKLSDFDITAYAHCEDNYYKTKAELHSPFPLVITSWCYEINFLGNPDAKYTTHHANHIFADFDAEYPDIIIIPDRDALYQLLKDLLLKAIDLIQNNYPFEGDDANLNEVIELTNFIKEYDSMTNFQLQAD